jgi:hypothetical protein
MKKLFSIFAVLMLSAFAANNASAQCCPNPVLTTCIGDCPETSSSFTVKEAGCFTACLNNSLCGTSVRVLVKVDNRVVAAGPLPNGESREFCAEAGETITAEIIPIHTNTNIQCIRLGEAILNVCPVVTQ